jgi:cell division protein FtsL
MTAVQQERAPARAPRPAPKQQPKARPPLRVVEPERPARRAVDPRRRARLMTAIVVLVVVGSLFGLVASHVVLTQGQFRLEQLEQQSADAQARYERLRLQVAQLESPERIVAAAQERLGMVPPPGVTYLSPTGVEDGASQQEEQPQAAADGLAAGAEDWSTIKRHLARP